MCESEGQSGCPGRPWPVLYISRLAGLVSLPAFIMTWWCCSILTWLSFSPFNIFLSLSSPALNYPINPPLTKGQLVRKSWQILSIDEQLCRFVSGVWPSSGLNIIVFCVGNNSNSNSNKNQLREISNIWESYQLIVHVSPWLRPTTWLQRPTCPAGSGRGSGPIVNIFSSLSPPELEEPQH